MISLAIEWNEDKRKSNLLKHGLDFVIASQLFKDTCGVLIHDVRNEEQRFGLIASLENTLLFVVFCIRNGAIRIISFRKARRKEKQIYNQINKTNF